MDFAVAAGAYLEPLARVVAEAAPVLFLDMFVYTSFLPMAAAFIGSRLAHYLSMGPADELFVIVELVFIFSFLFMAMNLEWRFWERAFNMDEVCLCILDIRSIYNVGLLTYYIMELVQIVDHVSRDGPMKSEYLGEKLTTAIGSRVYHWLDVISFRDQSTVVIPAKNIAAANFVLVVALLFGSISHFIYINTLYGQINTVRDFRVQLDLWLGNMQHIQRIQGEADAVNNNAAANPNAQAANGNQIQNQNGN